MIPAAFQPYLEQAPVCVLARTVLERLFLPARLADVFRRAADRQSEQALLFSQVTDLMLSVVLRTHPSVHAACRERAADLPATGQAVSDKLKAMELGVSAALVRDSAEQVGPVVEALGAALPPLVPGYRTRVIDGNHLGATERRLTPLRRTWAAALPGAVLAVYDRERDVVTRVVLIPDGHAQERSAFDQILPEVAAGDLWVADRNFCTLGLLAGVMDAGACFVIRQHGALKGEPRGEPRAAGRRPAGDVSERAVAVDHEGRALVLRRVTVALDTPTRDGDAEIHVLTNLPAEKAPAARVADVYRERRTIEGRFYEVARTLNAEPDTPAYPKAALFAFRLGLVASNAVALLRAALRSAHPAAAVADMSAVRVAEEVRRTAPGMMVARPPAWWAAFGVMPAADFAAVLRDMAARVNPADYREAKRGPKKKPPPKTQYKNGGHVSTHRLLEEQKRKN